tara:strand:- start:86 stop:304 length:219 start_codon:yes stop_codon:yes gene_type:complete
MTLSDQIRAAINNSGISRYLLAQEAGIRESSLTRFMQGHGITTTTLDTVAHVLRMSIETKGPRAALLKKARR